MVSKYIRPHKEFLKRLVAFRGNSRKFRQFVSGISETQAQFLVELAENIRRGRCKISPTQLRTLRKHVAFVRRLAKQRSLAAVCRTINSGKGLRDLTLIALKLK